jgi:inorganic pyrophosphatase
MDYAKINYGKNAPQEVNVLIEIPMNGGAIKYEFDKETGALWVDRFVNVSMQYPCNYGFIPHTLSGDGDPVDVLVYSAEPIHPGALIKARPIGVLVTKDENGEDEKILAVPAEKIDPFFADIKDYNHLPQILLERISHFFRHYKDLEKNKWVEVVGWGNAEKAKAIISEGIKRAKNF